MFGYVDFAGLVHVTQVVQITCAFGQTLIRIHAMQGDTIACCMDHVRCTRLCLSKPSPTFSMGRPQSKVTQSCKSCLTANWILTRLKVTCSPTPAARQSLHHQLPTQSLVNHCFHFSVSSKTSRRPSCVSQHPASSSLTILFRQFSNTGRCTARRRGRQGSLSSASPWSASLSCLLVLRARSASGRFRSSLLMLQTGRMWHVQKRHCAMATSVRLVILRWLSPWWCTKHISQLLVS